MHKFLKLMVEDGEGGGGGAGDGKGGAGDGKGGAGDGKQQQQQAEKPFYEGFKDAETKETFAKMFPTIKDPEALAKSAIHAQRALGQKGFPIPQKPEEVVPFLQTHFKVPKDGKGYDLSKVIIPDVITNKDEAKAALPVFADECAKLGLMPHQTEGLLNFYYGLASKEVETSTAARNEAATNSTKALQKEWGADFTKNMAVAEMALSTLGGADVVKAVQDAGLHNNSTFVKMLLNAGKLMKEDPATGKLSTGGFATGPQQASQEIDLLYANKEFMKAYNDVNDPGHKPAQDKMRTLFQIKNGELGRQAKK